MDANQVMDLPPLQSGAPSAADPVALYQRMMMLRRSLPPSPLEAQRQQALEDYQGTMLNDELPDRTPMQAFASQMVPTANRMDPFDMIRNGITAADAQREATRQEMFKRKQAAAQLVYNDVAERAKLDSAEERSMVSSRGLLGAGATGNWKQAKDDAGNLYWYNDKTGERKVVPATKLKLWEDAYKQAFKLFTDQRDPEAHNKAVEQANAVVGGSPTGVTDTGTAQPPTVPIGAPTSGKLPDKFSVDPEQLPPEVRNEVERLVRRLELNPDNDQLRANTVKRLREVAAQFPQGPEITAPAPVPAATVEPTLKGPSPIKYLDPRTEKSNEAYGSAEGKDLAGERKSLADLHGTSAATLGDIGTLRALYKNFDVPEGKFADLQQGIKSGLRSFDIDVGSATDAASIAQSLATGMALKIRTQGQQNLLPGAMSNYEDQLLQNMAPTLGRTQAGRMALLDMMQHIAEANKRLAEEATTFSTANGNKLTPDWYARKERIAREEMAKLAVLRHRMLQSLGAK